MPWGNLQGVATIIKTKVSIPEGVNDMFASRAGKIGIGTSERTVEQGEQRNFRTELRASGDGRSLVGYAALFNSLSQDLNGFKEQIKPGAFKRTLAAGADVRALLNHDPNYILGRTKSGTLKLSEDSTGLRCEISLPATQWGSDVRESVARGDLDQMSFGFRCVKDSWALRSGNNVRTLEDVDLIDISVVTFPAYQSTSVSARNQNQRGNTTMNSQIRSLYDERAKIVSEQRALLDAGKENTDQFRDLERAYNTIDAQVRQAEREDMLHEPANEGIRPEPGAYNREQERRGRGIDPSEDPTKSVMVYAPGEFRTKFKVPTSTPEATRAFRSMLAGERRAVVMQADKDVSGGLLVENQKFSGEVLMDLHDLVFIRKLARVITEPYASSIFWPVLATTVGDSDWTAELSIGALGDMKTEGFTLSPKPSAKYMRLSETLVRKSNSLAETLVRSELSYKFGITEEKAFLTGDGAGKPMGVFTVATGGGAGITTARDVSTSNSATEIKCDNLLSVVESLKAQYRSKAVWVFSRQAVGQIRRLKIGDGSYIWQPSMQLGVPSQLLGYPVYESEYVPNTFTSGLYVGIFGDFSSYIIVTALDTRITVLTELFAMTNEIGYVGRMEVDGAPANENAFARVKLA